MVGRFQPITGIRSRLKLIFSFRRKDACTPVRSKRKRLKAGCVCRNLSKQTYLSEKMKDPDYSPEQIKILQAMTPAQKLKSMSSLYWGARRLKAAWLRDQHPDWSEERIQKEVREIFMYMVT
jgi:hypothetical protein